MCTISKYLIIDDMSSDKILPTLVITHDGYEQLCHLIKGKLMMPSKKKIILEFVCNHQEFIQRENIT